MTSSLSSSDSCVSMIEPSDCLARALMLGPGESPFPWQMQLLNKFIEGDLPAALDIPTGLGKTAVMAIWLVARAAGARLPRRLFYIVDRRAVVDQATEVASGLRNFVERESRVREALGLASALPISTLRGQYVDNREWLEDPTSPAIILGTVDMVGSRLLFEGYGISRRMRPYHAGLMGVDSLIVLDEAHLVPPFERLLETISLSEDLFPDINERTQLVPRPKVLTLSATGRGNRTAFVLGDDDFKPETVTHQRLTAAKSLQIRRLDNTDTLADSLAREAWALTGGGKKNLKVIVYCDRREDAIATKKATEQIAKGNRKEGIPQTEVDCELFVGGRRVHERQDAASWLKTHSFLAGSKSSPNRPTFVFATSAGEVGVDLNADHMACDLVTWERMVQRLGRVNRRGEGNAKIIVLQEPDPKPSKTVEKALAKAPAERDKKEEKAVAYHYTKVQQAQALARPFELLPQSENSIDVSPKTLYCLRPPANSSEGQILAKATSSVPLRPGITRPLVDAWAMTSLKDHTGRPRVQPWLRGWIDDEPQTTVVWRTHLPFPEHGGISLTREIEAFFEAAPTHTSEMLETETSRVVDWLKARAALIVDSTTPERKAPTDHANEALNQSQPCAVILEADGSPRVARLTIADFLFTADDKKENERRDKNLGERLKNATLILDSRFGGLSRDGLLDVGTSSSPSTLDGSDDWLPPVNGNPAIRFRVCVTDAGCEMQQSAASGWRQRFRIPIDRSAEGDPLKWLVVEKWRYDVATPDDGSASQLQALDQHQQLTATKASDLAKRLSLSGVYAKMLEIAARLHDEGKRHVRWQNAFNAPRDGRPYAKTPGPINQSLLDGYRHEFASLAAANDDHEFKALPSDLQDLVLHLIATHHGFSRPNINTSGCPDLPPSILEERAREVALRFARLQRNWGPWGLAWWESLLRAADQQASRNLEVTPKEN